jgi:hypothetical protein
MLYTGGWCGNKLEPVMCVSPGMGKLEDKMPDWKFCLCVMLPQIISCSHVHSFPTFHKNFKLLYIYF